MTRTAADVQAEIDTLEEREKAWWDEAFPHLQALMDKPGFEIKHAAMRVRVQENNARRDALEAEMKRLTRAELDAATPPDVRATALRLRAAHRSVDGWAMGAEDPWEALDTSEAAAWAAVAREAGR